jgi:hypothetical protein
MVPVLGLVAWWPGGLEAGRPARPEMGGQEISANSAVWEASFLNEI